VIVTLEAMRPNVEPKQMNPLTLAFVGDVVFELLVRERLVANGDRPVGQLHNMAVTQVKASAQAVAYHLLEPVLDEEEMSILKRGRNSHSVHPPKNSHPQDYRKATGVEALFGYLYLKGRAQRVEELFELIYQNQTQSNPENK
jgi:ribonuclease-3 family protein